MRNETWGKNNKNGSSIYASENNVLSRDEGFSGRETHRKHVELNIFRKGKNDAL
jgi:hypothetical protein